MASLRSRHLFEVAVRELVLEIPTDAQRYGRGFEVAPLERGLVPLHGYDSRRAMVEPKGGL